MKIINLILGRDLSCVLCGVLLQFGVVPLFQVQPLVVGDAVEPVVNGCKCAGCQGLPALDTPSNKRAGLSACVHTYVRTSEEACHATVLEY